jgi:hypothetical protein
MHTMNLTCDVPPDRTVTLKLPETIPPGRHDLLVVIDARGAGPAFRDLSPEEQGQRVAAIQTRWRDRLSSSDEFAVRKRRRLDDECHQVRDRY